MRIDKQTKEPSVQMRPFGFIDQRILMTGRSHAKGRTKKFQKNESKPIVITGGDPKLDP
jgi:hypothetical protein